MNKISAIIIVKDKPAYLFKSLESIDDFVFEIILGSIDLDNTYKEKLLKNNKIKIIDLPSNIPFADLVKDDLKKYTKGDYILYLDPDEIFPTINNQQLTMLLQKYDYFYFPRKNIIFDKWIQHSRWWPDNQLRLFKKDSLSWPKQLHPILYPKGNGFTFPPDGKNAILHYNYVTIDQYLEKATRYAKTEAKDLSQRKKDYSLNEVIKQSISEFISRFFADEGYKDGIHGFVLSFLQMFYYFLVYFYYWEEKKYSFEDQQIVNNANNYFKQGLKETNYWLIKKNLINNVEKIKLKLKNKLI